MRTSTPAPPEVAPGLVVALVAADPVGLAPALDEAVAGGLARPLAPADALGVGDVLTFGAELGLGDPLAVAWIAVALGSVAAQPALMDTSNTSAATLADDLASVILPRSPSTV